MAEPIKPPIDFYLSEANSRFLEIGISPSIGHIRSRTNREANRRPRNIFQSDWDKEVGWRSYVPLQPCCLERWFRGRESSSVNKSRSPGYRENGLV